MMFNLMLTGVGGEGVLTVSSILARAANREGHFVRGLQLHGLAQRGGVTPVFVRFGNENELHSPEITAGDADLVLAFEPLEAVRTTYYARKEKTAFLINNWPHMPVYANLLDLPYPEMDEIIRRVKPFAKSIGIFDTHRIALETFGMPVLGNTILLGVAIGSKSLPLSEKSMRQSIADSVRHNLETNLNAFGMGLKIGENK